MPWVGNDWDMGEQRAWPVRYQVTIRSSLGQIRKLRVLTWLGPEKAIAIAAHADGHGYGSPDGILDIDVEELGPADAMNAALSSARAIYLTGWNSEAVAAGPFARRHERATFGQRIVSVQANSR